MPNLKCPKCRTDRLATVESIQGLAFCTVDKQSGEISFDGNTDVLWDTSTSHTDARKGTMLHCCNCSYKWFPKVLWPKTPSEVQAARDLALVAKADPIARHPEGVRP